MTAHLCLTAVCSIENCSVHPRCRWSHRRLIESDASIGEIRDSSILALRPGAQFWKEIEN